MDIALFRQSFPEFSDEYKYTDSMITFWSGLGEKLLNETRWDDFYVEGLQLFTAHHLIMAYQNETLAAANKTPGTGASGVVSSKSVGGVSVSYDTGSITLQDAGNFNLTTYGRSFWQLMLIVGMGGYQV